MTAEAIASVMRDLRAGRFRSVTDSRYAEAARKLMAAPEQGPVIDATHLYESYTTNPRGIHLYDDHNCAPPFVSTDICYQNEHGNVIVMSADALDAHEDESIPSWDGGPECDWDKVRWIVHVLLFLGGTDSDGRPFEPVGPAITWALAVYADGALGDIHWTHTIPEYPMDRWNTALCVLLGTLTFLTCRNIEMVEPSRPRGERRRIERTGVKVNELVVFPTGKVTRGRAGERTGGVPLTSVRGHWAKYGPAYDRGLLFGKYEGRFWVPMHARGSDEHGESQHDYRIEVDR